MNKYEKIKKYKEVFKKNDIDTLKKILETTLEQISFLESIYMTGGMHKVYSERFCDSAVQERQELCLVTSAIYSILDERKN